LEKHGSGQRQGRIGVPWEKREKRPERERNSGSRGASEVWVGAKIPVWGGNSQRDLFYQGLDTHLRKLRTEGRKSLGRGKDYLGFVKIWGRPGKKRGSSKGLPRGKGRGRVWDFCWTDFPEGKKTPKRPAEKNLAFYWRWKTLGGSVRLLKRGQHRELHKAWIQKDGKTPVT